MIVLSIKVAFLFIQLWFSACVTCNSMFDFNPGKWCFIDERNMYDVSVFKFTCLLVSQAGLSLRFELLIVRLQSISLLYLLTCRAFTIAALEKSELTEKVFLYDRWIEICSAGNKVLIMDGSLELALLENIYLSVNVSSKSSYPISIPYIQ